MRKGKRLRDSQCQIYSFLRSVDGGPMKSDLMSSLKSEGISARSHSSIYVGHTAIAVFGNKREHAKARRIIYGRGY